VHDELDLAFGELRLKVAGGDGGHRGLRSISAELQNPGYGRLRLGSVGRPPTLRVTWPISCYKPSPRGTKRAQ